MTLGSVAVVSRRGHRRQRCVPRTSHGGGRCCAALSSAGWRRGGDRNARELVMTGPDTMPDEGADPDSPEGRGGAASVIPAAPPGSGRGGLDRRRVLGAAIEFIDQKGLNALTM